MRDMGGVKKIYSLKRDRDTAELKCPWIVVWASLNF
jgi:hypothetical protein